MFFVLFCLCRFKLRTIYLRVRTFGAAKVYLFQSLCNSRIIAVTASEIPECEPDYRVIILNKVLTVKSLTEIIQHHKVGASSVYVL